MALRIDSKNILGLFQQSRAQAEDIGQKDRLAAMNRQLEEKRMSDEAQYRNANLDIQRGEAADNSRLRGLTLEEQKRQTTLTAERYAADDIRQANRDRSDEAHWRANIALGYAQLNKERESATGHMNKQELDLKMAELNGGFRNEVWDALKGGDPNGKAIDLSADPLVGVNTHDANGVRTYLDGISPRLQAVARVIQKYDELGYDAGKHSPQIVQDMQNYVGKISGENAWSWARSTSMRPRVATESSVQQMGLQQVRIPGRPAQGLINDKDGSWNGRMYNQLADVNSYIFQIASRQKQQ